MKNIRKLILLLFVLVLTGCSKGYTDEELLEMINDVMPEAKYDTSYDLESFQAQIVQMLDEKRDGVVGITISTSNYSAIGSGVIVGHEDDTYYVMTNYHVVEEADDLLFTGELKIVYEKNSYKYYIDDVTYLGGDVTTDLALVSFESNEIFEVIEFGDSYQLQTGEFVYAIGNPLGEEYYGTVTSGIISGTTRFIRDEEFDATLIQHDAAISPGNSGGALVDINGYLIGVNNMKIVDEDVTNIGFAIPSNTVKRIYEDLLDDGKIEKPYLGILANINQNNCNTESGVCLEEVVDGGAAKAGGLKVGDTITGFKNIDKGMTDFIVITSFNELKEVILNSNVGDKVIIQYIDDSSNRLETEEITLQEKS